MSQNKTEIVVPADLPTEPSEAGPYLVFGDGNVDEKQSKLLLGVVHFYFASQLDAGWASIEIIGNMVFTNRTWTRIPSDAKPSSALARELYEKAPKR